MASQPVLYHIPSSYYSTIARLALVEKGVAYRGVLMDLYVRQEHYEPWYVAINPHITVPAMVVGETVLTTSDEIISYVDTSFDGPSLSPTDDSAKKEQAAWLARHQQVVIEDMTMGTLLPEKPFLYKKFLSALTRQKERASAYMKSNDELAQAYQAKIEVIDRRLEAFSSEKIAATQQHSEADIVDYLQQLNDKIGDNKLFLGDDYTLCDVVNTALLARLQFIKRDELIAALPAVQAYWQRLKQRDSFSKASVPIAMNPVNVLQGLAGALGRHFGILPK